MTIGQTAENPVLWQNNHTVAKGFINPDHDLVYLISQSRGEEFFNLLDIEDMAQIIAKVARRRKAAKYSPAPSNDDLPF